MNAPEQLFRSTETLCETQGGSRTAERLLSLCVYALLAGGCDPFALEETLSAMVKKLNLNDDRTVH